LGNITLGQPKINVVRRQPSSGKPDSVATTPVIEARRSSLELVRRSKGSGEDAADSAAASTVPVPVPVPEIGTSGSKVGIPDLRDLARDVYPLVKRLLALERERLG
jgi:hypothetical protein